jgi:acetolactate synthase-1/2/3 large subunit
VRRQLPLICVILNNSTLAWIKHTAAARYPDAMVSQDFTQVSYADAAKALGAQVSYVDELSQFDLALKNAFASRTTRPWVIEARTCGIETPVLPARALPQAEASAGRGGY